MRTRCRSASKCGIRAVDMNLSGTRSGSDAAGAQRRRRSFRRRRRCAFRPARGHLLLSRRGARRRRPRRSTEVKTSQSKRSSTARSSESNDSGGAISMVGNWITVAPDSSKRRLSSEACSRARVTTMRLPKSGFDSNQLMTSCSFTTSPTTISAGVGRFASATLRFDGRQRAGDRALLGRRRFRDHGDGTIGRDAVRGQLLRDGWRDCRSPS